MSVNGHIFLLRWQYISRHTDQYRQQDGAYCQHGDGFPKRSSFQFSVYVPGRLGNKTSEYERYKKIMIACRKVMLDCVLDHQQMP